MIDAKKVNEKLADKLSDLSKPMIDELKDMKMFTPPVLNVLYCLSAAFGLKSDLATVRTLLNNKFLLDKLNNFDVSKVTP